jgi:hypothetical protein
MGVLQLGLQLGFNSNSQKKHFATYHHFEEDFFTPRSFQIAIGDTFGLFFSPKVLFIQLFIFYSIFFGIIKPFASTCFLNVNIIPIDLKVR